MRALGPEQAGHLKKNTYQWINNSLTEAAIQRKKFTTSEKNADGMTQCNKTEKLQKKGFSLLH